jgi:hypothetical protein
MSDPLDLLRAANPVAEPRAFAIATRRRMIDAIVTHQPTSEGGWVAGLLRRLSRRRLYVIVVAAVLAAGCTAGAVAVLRGEQSAPLSGALPGPPGGKYSFSVIPSLGAGTVGWCIGEETQTPPPTLRELASKLTSDLQGIRANDEAKLRQGHLSLARRRQLTRYVETAIPNARRPLPPARYRSSPLLREFARLADGLGEGTGVCGEAAMRGRPIIDAMTAGGSGHQVGLYLTAPDVAAVRISPAVTVLTAANSQLPDGYRYAVVVEPKGRSGPVAGSGPWPVAALNRNGRVIPARLVLPSEGETTVSWQAQRGRLAVGPPARSTMPPPAACEIDPRGLAGAKLYYGAVVVHVHGEPQLEGDPYVSCAYMQLYYRGYTVQAAVLLDARHPGQLPALVPDSVAVRSQPNTVNEPQRSVQQPITARRIGDAWLAVETLSHQGSSTLTERLTVLNKLTACIRLQGTLCS